MTTAETAGFLARATIGLRPPRSVSHDVEPARGGVALHYGGPPVGIASHGDCLATWRGWQNYHMDVKRWSDLAYTVGTCDHGYVLAGRGYGLRTAANGTNDANDRYLAVCWIGGKGDSPTPEALSATAWAVQELRRQGAGLAVKPHRTFRDTECPGNLLLPLAQELDGRAIVVGTRPPVPPPPQPILRLRSKGPAVEHLQRLLRAHGHVLRVDGDFGPATDRAVRRHQAAWRLVADGIVGPRTWATLETRG